MVLSDHVDDGVNATKDSSKEYDYYPEENECEEGFPYCAPVTIAWQLFQGNEGEQRKRHLNVYIPTKEVPNNGIDTRHIREIDHRDEELRKPHIWNIRAVAEE